MKYRQKVKIKGGEFKGNNVGRGGKYRAYVQFRRKGRECGGGRTLGTGEHVDYEETKEQRKRKYARHL